MELEKLEYKVVMDDGPDTEALGHVRDPDFGATVYMAALTKYRTEEQRKPLAVNPR